jgi:hypothetical protein
VSAATSALTRIKVGAGAAWRRLRSMRLAELQALTQVNERSVFSAQTSIRKDRFPGVHDVDVVAPRIPVSPRRKDAARGHGCH